MPIYEFKCNKCQKNFEKILSSTDISEVTCSHCESSDVTKQISSGNFRVGGATPLSSPLPAAPACGGSGFS